MGYHIQVSFGITTRIKFQQGFTNPPPATPRLAACYKQQWILNLPLCEGTFDCRNSTISCVNYLSEMPLALLNGFLYFAQESRQTSTTVYSYRHSIRILIETKIFKFSFSYYCNFVRTYGCSCMNTEWSNINEWEVQPMYSTGTKEKQN